MRLTGGSPLSRGLVGALLLLALAWTLVPIGWMVFSSFKPAEALTANPPSVDLDFTLEHYDTLFSGATRSAPTSRTRCSPRGSRR